MPYYFQNQKKREKQSVKTYLILIYTERIINHLKTKKKKFIKNPKRVQTHQKKKHCKISLYKPVDDNEIR